MKQVDEMPTSGQFVAVWIYQCEIFSVTLKWVDGLLIGCDKINDIKKDANGIFNRAHVQLYKELDAKYFIAD